MEIEHLIDIETKTHAKHHAYIDSQIEVNAIAKERWETIKIHVLGVAVVAFFGWIGSLVLAAIQNWKGHP